jgi:uncharacterized protein
MASPLPQVLDSVTSADVAPAEPDSRATLIDALRGFALIGVCLGNILTTFSFWGFDGTEALLPRYTLPADDVAYFLYHALVDGKFYSIFSLLFGLGFALQLGRRGDPDMALGTYRRRLRILAAIGFVHLALFWPGDILLFYALMGFVLLRLRDMEERRLLRWVVLLLIAPVVFTLPTVIDGNISLGMPLFIVAFGAAKALGIDITSGNVFIEHFIQGGLGDVVQLNLVGIWYRFGDLLASGRPFKVLAMFLLGLLIGRYRAWEHLDQHAPVLRRVLAWGMGIGLPACLGLAALGDLPREVLGGWRGVAESVLYAIGVAPLALAYAAGFVLLWRKPTWQRRLRVFAPTGRMALTNYLTQTVIGITIFYGVGFGLGGRVGPTYFLPIVLAILVLQTTWSHWWLARYRFGPMEWVWRSLTYGRRQPLRRG